MEAARRKNQVTAAFSEQTEALKLVLLRTRGAPSAIIWPARGKYDCINKFFTRKCRPLASGIPSDQIPHNALNNVCRDGARIGRHICGRQSRELQLRTRDAELFYYEH